MAPRIIDKQEKRELIAHAASRVFGEKGFDRTRMQDVARAAGVGKGTLYEYFRDKEELLQGAFEVFVAEVERQMLADLDPTAPPLDTLSKLADLTVEAMKSFGDDYRFFLEYMLHISRTKDDFPVLRRLLLEFRQVLTALLSAAAAEGSTRRDMDPAVAAAAMAAWFDGAILHWIVLPEGPSMEEMTASYLDMTFKGLLAHPTAGGTP